MTTNQAHGSKIIRALEEAWEAIQQRHPDVPRVVVITGSGRERSAITWGHFYPGRWANDGGERVHELFASGELLSLGGRRMMETLLHEAAHGLATVRGIKDTSNAGRYHNRRFVALAVELGLSPAQRSAGVDGLKDCRLGDETAQSYADVIERLDAAKLPYLRGAAAFTTDPVRGSAEGHTETAAPVLGEGVSGVQELGEEDVPAPRAGKRFAIVCGCETKRRIQITPATYEAGGILCAVCGDPFTPEGP
ncbi:hypothetical protein [Streptomyces sp. G-5]|uniref:hypothetical protein n=1 Tax=Streptomyces sp. G-5 TaxID=2977231 RepID=UPI0021D20035|nr:hypothetical protein [Streptomyces sp. G-5]MCU4750225.1 hypothetical protein [Streptomyces sp. G-5]